MKLQGRLFLVESSTHTIFKHSDVVRPCSTFVILQSSNVLLLLMFPCPVLHPKNNLKLFEILGLTVEYSRLIVP